MGRGDQHARPGSLGRKPEAGRPRSLVVVRCPCPPPLRVPRSVVAPTPRGSETRSASLGGAAARVLGYLCLRWRRAAPCALRIGVHPAPGRGGTGTGARQTPQLRLGSVGYTIAAAVPPPAVHVTRGAGWSQPARPTARIVDNWTRPAHSVRSMMWAPAGSRARLRHG